MLTRYTSLSWKIIATIIIAATWAAGPAQAQDLEAEAAFGANSSFID